MVRRVTAFRIAMILLCLLAILSLFAFKWAGQPGKAGSACSSSGYPIQQEGKTGIPGISKLKRIPQADNTVSLPSSLTIIGEGAFEGTAMGSVILPDAVRTIGDYAFANNPNLQKISIPRNIQYIGKNAFTGSSRVTITSVPDGFARTWAKENGIPFIPVAIFRASDTTVQSGELPNAKDRNQRIIKDEQKERNIQPKPTDRMAGDLCVLRYEGITAFHIQGRSPPAA